jgi:hypothetical protein
MWGATAKPVDPASRTGECPELHVEAAHQGDGGLRPGGRCALNEGSRDLRKVILGVLQDALIDLEW